MAIIHEERHTYMNGGRPMTIVVRIKDDAYKDCTPEEIKARRRDFEETALRLIAEARAEKEKGREESELI